MKLITNSLFIADMNIPPLVEVGGKEYLNAFKDHTITLKGYTTEGIDITLTMTSKGSKAFKEVYDKMEKIIESNNPFIPTEIDFLNINSQEEK